jgi:hypothetical protein
MNDIIIKNLAVSSGVGNSSNVGDDGIDGIISSSSFPNSSLNLPLSPPLRLNVALNQVSSLTPQDDN